MKTPNISLPNPSKKPLILFGGLVVVAILGVGGYMFISKWQADRSSQEDDTPTITVDGKEYQASFLKYQETYLKQDQEAENEPELTPGEQLGILDWQIQHEPDNFQLYISAAETALMIEDLPEADRNSKAISYYERAKAALKPDHPSYEGTLRSLDEAINALRNSQ